MILTATEDTTVEQLLEIWRELLENGIVNDDDIVIEYITIDGTTNEYDDRGLDFDILSNTK